MIAVSSGDHQHSLLLTPAELADGSEVTILSSAASGHSHFVRVTAADFTALKAGMIVKKKSCADVDHEWVLACQSSESSPGAPLCDDECGDGATPANACP